jgi:hypothetical protein
VTGLIDLLIVHYPKGDQKRSIDNWFHSLAVVDLEPLYSERGILAKIPIDNPCVVTTLAQGDLDLSDVRRITVIRRVRQRERYLLTGTCSQRKSGSEQKYEPRYSRHISLSTLFGSFARKKLAGVVTAGPGDFRAAAS